MFLLRTRMGFGREHCRGYLRNRQGCVSGTVNEAHLKGLVEDINVLDP